MRDILNFYLLQLYIGIRFYLKPMYDLKNKIVFTLFKYNLAKYTFFNFDIVKNGKSYKFSYDKKLNIYEYLEDELYVAISWKKYIFNHEDKSPIIEVNTHVYNVYYKNIFLFTKGGTEQYNTLNTCLSVIDDIEKFLDLKSCTLEYKDFISIEKRKEDTETKFMFVQGEFFVEHKKHPAFIESTHLSPSIALSKSKINELEGNYFLNKSNIDFFHTISYSSLSLERSIHCFKINYSIEKKITSRNDRIQLIIDNKEQTCTLVHNVLISRMLLKRASYTIKIPNNDKTISAFNDTIDDFLINYILVQFKHKSIRELCEIPERKKINIDHINLYKMSII